MDKCSINNDFGQCKNKSTKYIFGIELCDNHHHILFNMSDNIITKLPNKVIAKIDRNEPCSCGSEKKFKKCCINK